MCWLILTVIASLCICSVRSGPTLRYSSGCSVDLCERINVSNSSNSSCSHPPPCFRFETSTNLSVCGPQVTCSLFDPCNNARQCTSNTSVCIMNTCCSVPICMPLSLTSSCSMYTTNFRPSSSWSGRICSNATWAENGTIIISSYLNGSSWFSLGDIFIDPYNNIYVVDLSYYRVLKFPAYSTSVFSVAAVTSNSVTYQAQNIFVDANGTIFVAEYWSSGMTTYYRVVKYTQNVGSTIYGPTTCGTSLNELCSCASLFVDQTGSIYYSDASNHRVLKFQQFASAATVVAGTSGSSGSMLYQLSNPGGIYVDATGALYVADQSNYRVMKFTSGNTMGTVLFTTASYQTPNGLAVDNIGAVYTGTNNGIFKWVPGSSSSVVIIPSVYWGVTRVRFDTFGNIYTSGYSSSNIYRYNITANYC